MAAFDSSMAAEGVVSIDHAKLSYHHRPISFRISKLSYRHRPISFRISNCCPFTSRLFVLGSCIVGNLDERCMMIIMGIYFDESPLVMQSLCERDVPALVIYGFSRQFCPRIVECTKFN